MFLVPTVRRSALQNGFVTGMNDVEKELSQWFDAMNNRTTGAGFSALTEKDGFWDVSIDVPGVSREQLAINIEGRRVSIQTKEGALREYSSAFVMPAEVNSATSEAKLENGVLTLKLARKVEEKNSTLLEIK